MRCPPPRIQLATVKVAAFGTFYRAQQHPSALWLHARGAAQAFQALYDDVAGVRTSLTK
jgi:hypothetical protein